MKVCVIGCGPTGLLASATAMEMGHKVEIWSQPKKSELFGAQYLHCQPPLVQGVPEFTVNYEILGGAEAYRKKVYGPNWDGTVSPEDFQEPHQGWDIRFTYEVLWSLFEGSIHPFTISNFDEANTLIDFDQYDVIFSSVPRTVWKTGNEVFLSQDVLAVGDTTWRKLDVPIPPNTVVCNGLSNPSWYRGSHIDGFKTLEWPLRDRFDRAIKPPVPGVVKVKKPLAYRPDPNKPNPADQRFYHIGRYGEWKKGVLTSDAIATVRKVLGDG
ncbi:oxidoreductase [Gordonia phage Genamy16]|uniref:Oxidoreductase n=2 Tax=Lambovirus TaxID=2843412 RepID=A0A9E7Q505_9CAUD|nr:oxidoreductase [Gordonia phage Genamy16]UVF61774.1 oxidoreductase [Gordonia phage NovaSharks]UVK63152.1 oxidoreductase [Gordonia phage Rumi]WNM65374.1 oxidoreductase [Gordonia phage Alyssamiracle]